jgi:RNA polymerase sigma-54 factor
VALGQRQELRQSQSLVMTPQLQQAIKLLQLTNLELGEFVDQEIERNPLLEMQEGDRPERGENAPAEETARETDGVDTASLSTADELPGDNDQPLDMSYDDVYADNAVGEGYPSDAGLRGPYVTSNASYDDSGDLLEQTLGEEISLTDHLLAQLNMDIADPVDRMIGFHLIYMVDDAGYFSGELESVAAQVGATINDVERVLKRLQGFDPVGVFARDLRECLALQLQELNRYDPAIAALLDNLDLLAAHNHAALLERCGVSAEDLNDMIQELRHLNPKPGLKFSNEIAQTLVPDVFVRAGANGSWIVELNSDTLPKVLVNQQYYAEVSAHTSSRKDKAYIAEQLNSANWLVKSLEQRAQTILKVATELVRQQDAFFVRGVQHLRPLTLRDIAQAIEMHESTVSRVTANKYIATPRGTYQMKYFFTSAITSASGGEALSAESVRHRIKELIDKEAVNAVLSDDRIVEILRVENVDIARRTVAKYREAMRIPSSVMRRRIKQTATLHAR